MAKNESTQTVLARLEEKMNSMSDKQDLTYEQVIKTNGRVSSLERWRAGIIAAGTVIVLIIGWVITLITN